MGNFYVSIERWKFACHTVHLAKGIPYAAQSEREIPETAFIHSPRKERDMAKGMDKKKEAKKKPAKTTKEKRAAKAAKK